MNILLHIYIHQSGRTRRSYARAPTVIHALIVNNVFFFFVCLLNLRTRPDDSMIMMIKYAAIKQPDTHHFIYIILCLSMYFFLPYLHSVWFFFFSFFAGPMIVTCTYIFFVYMISTMQTYIQQTNKRTIREFSNVLCSFNIINGLFRSYWTFKVRLKRASFRGVEIIESLNLPLEVFTRHFDATEMKFK